MIVRRVSPRRASRHRPSTVNGESACVTGRPHFRRCDPPKKGNCEQQCGCGHDDGHPHRPERARPHAECGSGEDGTGCCTHVECRCRVRTSHGGRTRRRIEHSRDQRAPDSEPQHALSENEPEQGSGIRREERQRDPPEHKRRAAAHHDDDSGSSIGESSRSGDTEEGADAEEHKSHRHPPLAQTGGVCDDRREEGQRGEGPGIDQGSKEQSSGQGAGRSAAPAPPAARARARAILPLTSRRFE